jgi:DNA-binding GntR family transcriptional regulator
MAEFQRPPTAQEAVLVELRARILRGDLIAGTPLRQEDLASSLGVSRVPVREALRMLESEGHVRYAPHRGYRVADLGVEDLAETYRLRALIEDDLARRSITTMTPKALAHLEVTHRALAALEGAAAASPVSAPAPAAGAFGSAEARTSSSVSPTVVSSPSLAQANRAFHWAILRPGPRADRILTTLWDTSDAYRARWFADPANVTRGAHDHEAIRTAVRAQDPDRVVALLSAHREAAVQALTKTLP